MKRALPEPAQILEELAEKVIAGIDDLALTGFRAALDEMIRYHRFLLDSYATKNEAGLAFSYAEVTGDRFGAPYQEWIREYNRIFERAAARIGQDTDFVAALARTPLALMPRPAQKYSPAIISGILDLGTILVSRLEDWMTRRLTVETPSGHPASARLVLSGSDKTAFSDVIIDLVGAWEGLLQLVGSFYDWRHNSQLPAADRWATVSTSWQFLWHHLRNTAYFVTSAVWNEDEIGALHFEDALAGWPRVFEFELPDEFYSSSAFLLFPDLLDLNFDALKVRLSEIDADRPFIEDINPFALFGALLRRVHRDITLITSAVMIRWHLENKQLTDVAVRTANRLLHLERIDPEIGTAARDAIGFRSLFFGILRIELSGEHFDREGYGVYLNGLAAFLDQMSERRVVPNRVFTPSTIQGTEQLRSPFLSILLSSLPAQGDDNVTALVRNLVTREVALPKGDRSLSAAGEFFNQMATLLNQRGSQLERTTLALSPSNSFDLSAAIERLQKIFNDSSAIVKNHRAIRVKEAPIDLVAIERIRSETEDALLSSEAEIGIFRGFTLERGSTRTLGDAQKVTIPGIPKGVLTNPPMQWGWGSLDKSIIDRVVHYACRLIWINFWRHPRQLMTIDAEPTQDEFWRSIASRITDVAPHTCLLLDGYTRLLLGWRHQSSSRPATLNIENKATSQRAPDQYLVTVEGVDVYDGGLKENATLFSPRKLRSVVYEPILGSARLVDLSFDQEDDPWKITLTAEFAQSIVWDDTPVLEIKFPRRGKEAN